MTGPKTSSTLAKALALLFTGLWYLLAATSTLIAVLVLLFGVNVGVQIGPNGEPNFEAGGTVQMVLPVAFELDASMAGVRWSDGGPSASIEGAGGTLRFVARGRPWITMGSAAVMVALALWILAELAALCRSVRDGQPFVPRNALRLRRLALAFVFAEVWRAVMVYGSQAYVASHFTAEHLRFTAWPRLDPFAIVSALVLLVLAEVFRTGTRLDEDQSLTV